MPHERRTGADMGAGMRIDRDLHPRHCCRGAGQLRPVLLMPPALMAVLMGAKKV